MADLRVLIVGGGIGGLALARALVRGGATARLVEQAPAWRPLGAGIVLGANAVACLGSLGLGEAVAAVGHPMGAGNISDASGGRLQTIRFDALGPSYALHRAELHELLLAGAEGAQLQLGTTVEAVETRGEAAWARLSDGTEHSWDLIVGADGLRSKVRQLVFSEGTVQYAGYTCWRAVLTPASPATGMFEMWGDGLRLGIVPLSGGRVYTFLTQNTAPGGRDPETGRNAHVAALFQGFGGPAAPVLEALARPDTALMRHDIEDLDRQLWTRGRVALLGDAGHATTPNLGQGAGMAIEDALVLSRALATAPVPEALAAYADARRARVAEIVTLSRRLGALGQLSHPLTAALARWTMRLTPDALAQSQTDRLVRKGLALG